MGKISRTVFILFVALIIGYAYFVLSDKSITPTNTIAFPEVSWGCGNVFVYKVNEEGTAGISVGADKEKLSLSTSKKEFEIGKTDGLNITLRIGEKLKQIYCNDALESGTMIQKELTGKSGRATIYISNFDESDKSGHVWNRDYNTTVILNDVRFTDKSGAGAEIYIEQLIFKDVRVGWMVG